MVEKIKRGRNRRRENNIVLVSEKGRFTLSIGEVMKLVGFPGREERKQENSLASENEIDMGSRRTVKYFSHPPHSADEM